MTSNYAHACAVLQLGLAEALTRLQQHPAASRSGDETEVVVVQSGRRGRDAGLSFSQQLQNEAIYLATVTHVAQETSR